MKIYDCDGLGWIASAVFYALIGGTFNDGSNCGSTSLSLTDLVSTAVWWFGASKEYFMIVIIFGGMLLLFTMHLLVLFVMIDHIVV